MEEPGELPADLRELAHVHGVATEYVDNAGQLIHVSEETILRVLAALGVDATDSPSRAAALAAHRLRDWRRMLPPVFIATSGHEHRLWVHVPHGSYARAWVELEDGTYRTLAQMDVWVEPMEVDGRLIGEASFAVPADLPLGWHAVCATDGRIEQRSRLVVTPARITAAVGATTGVNDQTQLMQPNRLNRHWGLMAQLYSVRSSSSWGLGDLRDAAELARWSAQEHGAGFLLLNPLHASGPLPPMAASPYFPATRGFVNPLYLHIEDIPEFRRMASTTRSRLQAQVESLKGLNASADLLDRDRVWSVKRAALEAIFATGLTPERAQDFEEFRRVGGVALRDFATWCALTEAHGAPWSTWPTELQDPRSAAVAAFRARTSDRVTFYEWLQWLADGQLAALRRGARAAGMEIGIMHDLAVGVDPDGADAWALGRVLASGVSVGAPPDMYNQVGQDWNQPPWHPDALAEAAFLPYRDMLRANLRHSGALRIDHVLGLFRLWWIPEGMPASAGTYVTFDHDAMLGILCLEAERVGAVLVGEDLGTLEPWVREALAARGIVGTVISWFEQDENGDVIEPADWPVRSLASITTHDLPPTAGYLRDEHVRIRAELGLLRTDPAEERAGAAAQRDRWARICHQHGWLDPAVAVDSEQGLDALTIALHRALAASPCALLAVGLPDLVGDRRAQNQPGTNTEYPNWRMPLADGQGVPVLLDSIVGEQPPEPLGSILAVLAPRSPVGSPGGDPGEDSGSGGLGWSP